MFNAHFLLRLSFTSLLIVGKALSIKEQVFPCMSSSVSCSGLGVSADITAVQESSFPGRYKIAVCQRSTKRNDKYFEIHSLSYHEECAVCF